jgi:hypothetical protein
MPENTTAKPKLVGVNMTLEELRRLSGVGQKHQHTGSEGSNISITGTEKAELMRKHCIQPGTQEWFQLWFSKPYLTGEKPINGRQ